MYGGTCTQLLCCLTSFRSLPDVSTHAACRVAPEHRLVPDAALDWECLAASVQLLVSLEARDHEARLNLRRNTQCASWER